MATPDYSPHLKKVLRSYQNTAMTSLHGPGPNSYPAGGKLADFEEDTPPPLKLLDCHNKHDLYREISFKKLLIEESLKNKLLNNDNCRRCGPADEELKRRRPTSEGVGGGRAGGVGGTPSSCPPVETQTSGAPASSSLPSHVVKDEPVAGEIINLAPSSGGGGGVSGGSEVEDVIGVGECVNRSPSNSCASVGRPPSSCGGGNVSIGDVPAEGPPGTWVEPGVFLTPAPFPPQPWPVLAAADKGSPGARGRGLEEIFLDSEPIACFNVGGEKRLCLPQILNTVLREFSLAQINTICDELRIYCSRCTHSQLDALRLAGVLPHSATSCGLITNTDAQRLTQALLYTHPSRAPVTVAPSQQQTSQLRVYHTCFGKCKGVVWEELYNGVEAACIECEECHGLFTPTRFVCHAHRSLENQTIHWGFEADNWRTYLLLAKDQRIPLERAEASLKAFKNKFDPVTANHKRKQDGVEVKEDLPKKVRAEDVVSSPSMPPPPPHPYAVYDPMVLPYVWRQYGLPPHSWTNTPLVTRDGKPLPPPPPAFIRDSVPAQLPAYLSQGPPVLVDPGRVVPHSDSQKFERHYQPNVALAPPKVRDKLARESLSSKDVNSSNRVVQEVQSEKLSLMSIERVEVDCIKQESSPAMTGITPSSPISPSVDRSSVSQPQHPHHQIQPRKICSPDTSVRHPELELSTTDSDTDSVASVNNHNETVEEAEALLRGWSDRAAASKVAKLVAGLVSRLTEQDRHIAALKQRKEAQMRDQNQTIANLRSQLLTVARNQKDDEQLREKMCVMEGELRALREELCPRPVLSVITPTTPLKTEHSDIIIKTEPIDITDTC